MPWLVTDQLVRGAPDFDHIVAPLVGYGPGKEEGVGKFEAGLHTAYTQYVHPAVYTLKLDYFNSSQKTKNRRDGTVGVKDAQRNIFTGVHLLGFLN